MEAAQAERGGNEEQVRLARQHACKRRCASPVGASIRTWLRQQITNPLSSTKLDCLNRACERNNTGASYSQCNMLHTACCSCSVHSKLTAITAAAGCISYSNTLKYVWVINAPVRHFNSPSSAPLRLTLELQNQRKADRIIRSDSSCFLPLLSSLLGSIRTCVCREAGWRGCGPPSPGRPPPPVRKGGSGIAIGSGIGNCCSFLPCTSSCTLHTQDITVSESMRKLQSYYQK